MKYQLPIQDLIQNYFHDNKSIRFIADKHHVSRWVIESRIKSAGYKLKSKTRNLHKRKYTINEFVLDVLTDKVSWIIGWFMSDGFVASNCVFGIKLTERDSQVLELIRGMFEYNGPLTSSQVRIKDKTYNTLQLKMCSKHIVSRLNEFGVTRRKTEKEKFPVKIQQSKNESIIKNFIKGFFEGDGSILHYPQRNAFMFQIVGTKQILRQIQENLIHYVGLSRTKLTKYQRSKNHYALRYSGRLQVVRIMDWLYSGSQWHLNRKYQKYLDVKSIA